MARTWQLGQVNWIAFVIGHLTALTSDLRPQAHGAGFDALVTCLRPGGRLVCCGYKPGLDYGLDSSRLVLGVITVMGSRAGSRDEAQAALEAVEKGTVTPRSWSVFGFRTPITPWTYCAQEQCLDESL